MRLAVLLIAFLLLAAGCGTLTSPAETRIMVFAAHPDDETIGMATIIHRTLQSNGTAYIVMTTDGAPKVLGQGEREAAIRRNESLQALALLGVPSTNVIFLNYDDLGFIFEVNASAEIERIAQLIKDVDPDEIYVQAYEGGHIDHDATHFLVVQAARWGGTRARLYEYPEYNAFNWGRPIPEEYSIFDTEKYPLSTLALTKEEQQLKRRALGVYISQDPTKKILVDSSAKGLALLDVGAWVDDRQIGSAELRNGTQYRLLGIISEQSGIQPSAYTWTKFQAPSGASQHDLLQRIVAEADLALPHDTCELVSPEKRSLIFDYQSRTACLQQHLEQPEIVEERCRKNGAGCSFDAESVRLSMSLVNESISDYKKMLLPEDEGLKTDLRFAHYYVLQQPEGQFIGTLHIEPGSKVWIVLAVGNRLNESLEEVYVVLDEEGPPPMSNFRNWMEASGTRVISVPIGAMEPRTMAFVTFELDYSAFQRAFISPITISARGRRASGESLEDISELNIAIERTGRRAVLNEIWSSDIHPAHQPTIELTAVNVGNESLSITFELDGPSGHLQINQSCRVSGCQGIVIDANEDIYARTDVRLDLENITPGEYTIMGRIFSAGVLLDEQKAQLILNPDGSTTFYPFMSPEYEIGMIPNSTFRFQLDNCNASDYLPCRFFWADMYRPLPEYDYSKMPHVNPPLPAYMPLLARIGRTFDDYAQVVQATNILAASTEEH